MPRAKAKQAMIDTRNSTYREETSKVCALCVHFWKYSDSCQIEEARYRDSIDHHKRVVPWGTCDLFTAREE